MHVPIHQPRHQHRTAALNNFVTRLSGYIRTNADNLAIRDAQVACRDPRWIKLNKQRIAKKSWHKNFEQEETETMENVQKQLLFFLCFLLFKESYYRFRALRARPFVR
jgi:hypothetical protein